MAEHGREPCKSDGTTAGTGMPTVFGRLKADFCGMPKGNKLSIVAVQHEAYISFDEKETGAVALHGTGPRSHHGLLRDFSKESSALSLAYVTGNL